MQVQDTVELGHYSAPTSAARAVVIDAASLPKVAMPNRDNFVVSYSDGGAD